MASLGFNPYKSATIDFTMDSCHPSREGFFVAEGFFDNNDNDDDNDVNDNDPMLRDKPKWRKRLADPVFYIGDHVEFRHNPSMQVWSLKVNPDKGRRLMFNGVQGEKGTVFRILSADGSSKRTPLLGGAHVILKGCRIDNKGDFICDGKESPVRILDKYGNMDKKPLTTVNELGGAHIKFRAPDNGNDCNGTFYDSLNCNRRASGSTHLYGFVMRKAVPPFR